MQTCLSLVSVKIAWLSERCILNTALGSAEELESHSLVCATATGSGHCPLPPSASCLGTVGRLQANTG